ncbi:MAG: multiheme c-type cytochrome [Planctomycetota bacterium]
MRGALLLPPALLLLSAALAPLRAAAQPSARDVHLGAGSCAAAACHGGTEPDRNEHTIWRQKDQHAEAYAHLQGPLAVRIARRLKLDAPAHEAAECLSCHATDRAVVAVGDRFDVRDGVSCELCHGGSSRWLGPHASPGWKQRAPGEREGLGMRDLSTPQKRAAACVECHVGGADGVVDHDLIAAGHPPLVFDAAVFLEEMPPHWEDEADLSVPTWAAGRLAVAAALLDRLGRTAAEGHLDFAVFDCSSCHHAVYTGTIYERHDPAGRPGVPPFDWSDFEVMAAMGGEFDTKTLDELRDEMGTLSQTAFGAAIQMREDADAPLSAGRAEADAWLARIDERLARIERDELRASHATMQRYAFAIRALAKDRASDAFRAAYAALDEALDPKASYDPVRCSKLARAALR